MTNDNQLDQTVCNLPFEVVTIYDNGSQITQPNTESNLPPSVNVKIRIRNKEDTGRRGIISVPRLTAINWPKRVRLVNSAQTIMSFNLALEQNSDEAQKKSNRKLFQMFRPGGCLSIHRDEDGYSYMPSTSQELKRKSASGIENCESNKITGTGAFSLKKNEFSSSYSDTLKPPKTFLGKCKPGGCLDPPFGEDKYTYKPNVKDVQPLQKPVINTNSLQPDINIVDVKRKSTSQDQKQNILFGSYLDTEAHENTAPLVTYPSNLSSTKLKTKDSQNKKVILRMGEQMDLSRKLTNEYPEEYFIPIRKGRPKNENSIDKYKYEEKEPKLKEAYVNKDYTLKSQTPSELLSDALTITSKSFDEPLIEKQIITGLNTTKQPSLQSEVVLSNNTSKDNVKTDITTVFAKGSKKDENKFLVESYSHNNVPIIKNILSNKKESKNSFYKDISRSSMPANAIQDINFKTVEDINYKENALNYNLDFKDKQPLIYSLETSKEISPKLSKDSLNQTSISLNNIEIKEQNDILRQHQNVFNNETANIKQQIEEQSEENNKINPLIVKKSGSSENKYIKNISGQVISSIIIKDDINRETDYQKLNNVINKDVMNSEIDHPKSSNATQKGDDKSNHLDKKISENIFEDIREPTNLLVQDLEFKDNNKKEQSVDQGSERTTEPIIDIYPSVVSDILPKVTSLRSVNRILSLRDSDSVVKSPRNIDVNPKYSLFDNESFKSTHFTNDINNADKHNELNKSFDTLKNTLSSSLITRTSSQKMEIDTINTGLNNKHEISSNDDKLGDTDITLIPKMLQLSYPSPSDMTLDKHDRTISQLDHSVTTKIKTSKDTIESIETVPETPQQFNNFDSFQYSTSLNYSTNKEEDNKFNTSDSKILLNISKKDILSDDKFRKPSAESTNNNIRSVLTLPDTNFRQESDKDLEVVSSFKEDLDKSESVIETSEKKSSQKISKDQELKRIALTPKIKKSFEDNNKNIRPISSVAINFGFHRFTNETTGYSIETFDPSSSLARYPQDKIVTIQSILKKNGNDIKVEIDSETDLVMQIKSTRQLDGSGKLASNILNGYTNGRRTDNIREYSSEILLNKDKKLQETLKTVYETLVTIENNIIKLKEEAESLGREQLLLKKGLSSKEMKPNRINPKVGTCSCLQREIGLE